MSTVTANRGKLKALIHYVAYKCAHNPSALGAVKLNKVLWFSDMLSYLGRGQALTGERYIKKELGPVASHLLPLVGELEAEKAIAIRRFPVQAGSSGKSRVEYLALTKPDVNASFSAEEIAEIDEAIDYVCHKNTGRSISSESHDAIWRLTDLDEEIPYFAMLTRRLHEVTADDIAWAKQQVS